MIARRRMLAGVVALSIAPHGGRAEPGVALRSVRLRPIETGVQDSAGRSWLFWAEIVGDRLVVLNPIFTQCSSLCPLTNAVMAELQDLLAAELASGRVRLVSLSIDPFGDSAPALAAMARSLGAGPEWWWIRAEPAALDRLLRSLRAVAAPRDDHPPQFLLLDGATGRARRADGIPAATALAEAVRGALR